MSVSRLRSAHRFLALCAASGLALAHAARAADDAGAPAVSEVVVRGQQADDRADSALKTATPLVETPQSISVVDGQELDLRVVQNLNEALRYTAGVGPDTRGNTAGRYDQQTLRGFVPDQYLDGLRVIGSVNGYAVPQLDLGFLDRIEVVKGPASVLYGQASPGGLVALSSKLPTLDNFGEVAISGGSYGTARATFDLGGKLDEEGTFSFRLDGTGYRSDTETSHALAERYGVSPALTWRPDDKTSWTLLYVYQHDPKGGDYGAMPIQGSLLPNPNGQIPRDFYDGEPGAERFDRTQNAVTSLFRRDLGVSDWVFRQNLRFMRTETSYLSVYHDGFTPPDLTTIDRFVALANEAVDAFTVDNSVAGTLHTGPVTHTIVAGLDYQHTGQEEAAGFGGSAPPLDVFAPVYGGTVTPPAVSFSVRLNLQQTGLYAQDQLALGGWRLVLSGREDWVDASQFDRLAKTTSAFDEHKFTGRAGLLYLFPNGVAPYVSYTTSFQPQTSTDKNGDILPPTEGAQTEAGVKYQPKVWNTLLTAAVYDLRETNVATQDPSAPFGFGSIAAGEIRSQGVELEASAQPRQGVTLKASYTYIDNLVVKDNSGLQGARPYGVPQATANAFGFYTVQNGPLVGLGIGGGVRYLGRSFNGVAGGPAAGTLTIPDTTLVDLLASYDLARLNPSLHGLTFNLDATNLFDRRYVSSCYSTIWCWYGSGRDVQASLRYRW
ncbi:TonB-dependent siderophore receptor [Phenylobacterium sp.]|uniref:TonB-dependent siderophore receptor n=1 Tax=Phenylobacterium sp. TaxID=1871053 RepID=UPI0011F9ED07|nr:TonB-dependent siderophore receptor [Phenylobacterium sp.]THD59386.1 MAG: TonB-dependent siderophore receptor [Phenylobacterium sp.]